MSNELVWKQTLAGRRAWAQRRAEPYDVDA